MEKKLGSLFDGIGGFPLAAKRNGIRPVWASEIEKFPMAVTMYRFPEMKHMGDITKLHGENLPVVDVIAGRFSPCSRGFAMSGLIHCRETRRTCGDAFRSLFRAGTHHKRNAQAGGKEEKQQWKESRCPCSTSVYGLGKCAGSLLKRRTKRSRF